MSGDFDLPSLVTSSILTFNHHHRHLHHHHYDNSNNNNNINNTHIIAGTAPGADTYDYGATFILETNSTDNSSLLNATGYPPYVAQPDVAIRVLSRFHFIALPTIAVLGIISNTLSFCIFVSKTLRRTSCSIYLAARSMSDTGFLLAMFFTWLGDAMAVPVIHTVVVCQVMVFFSYVFGFLSVWLVVCITLENYIRICHPFSVSRFCTVPKARQVLLGLVILSIAVYQFSLWTTHVADHQGQQRCGNKNEFIDVIKVVVYGDMIITLAIPSVIIIFFMIAISISLVKSLKRQSRLKGSKPTPSTTLNNHTLTTHHESPTSNGPHTVPGQGHGQGHLSNGSKKKKPSCRRSSSPQAKVTKLLFAVSCTFLVLSLPSHIIRLRVVMLVMVKQSSLTPNLDEMLQVVFQIMYYLSFAVNLPVYLSCGESFRKVFIETYISCFFGHGLRTTCTEISQTTYTVVKMEQQEMTERKEEETSLIT